MKTRIDYAKLLKKYRDISPRFLQFVQKMKADCEKAMKLPQKSKERDALSHTIDVNDDMLHAYWYV